MVLFLLGRYHAYVCRANMNILSREKRSERPSAIELCKSDECEKDEHKYVCIVVANDITAHFAI